MYSLNSELDFGTRYRKIKPNFIYLLTGCLSVCANYPETKNFSTDWCPFDAVPMQRGTQNSRIWAGLDSLD